jgi:UDP-N-acetylglucosamine transferase subunit ALG13
MDELAAIINEIVVIQRGFTKYTPKHAIYFDFIGYDEIKVFNKKARLVVTHGGAGSIITALEHGAMVIAIPRLKKYSEHNNDHQLDIVNAMMQEGKIYTVYDIDDLYGMLSNVDRVRKLAPNKGKKDLKGFLKVHLSCLE